LHSVNQHIVFSSFNDDNTILIMVRAMLAACLTLVFASCAVAAPIFSENFDSCTQGSRDIPGFEIDVAGLTDMSCDSSQRISLSYSNKVLPVGAQLATLVKSVTLPVDGREITASFWLRWSKSVLCHTSIISHNSMITFNLGCNDTVVTVDHSHLHFSSNRSHISLLTNIVYLLDCLFA
jgi:hypothetical protein